MHWQAYSYIQVIKSLLPHYFHRSKVVEFGAACVNYSIAEQFENPEQYFAVDLAPAAGVNVVCEAQTVKLGARFDVAISCECFEHNPHYMETFTNMIGHVRDGGLVLFTCATTGRAEHGTTRTTPEQSPGTQAIGWDYYRNITEQDFSSINLDEVFSDYYFLTNEASQDLYFAGVKKGGESHLNKDFICESVLIHQELSLLYERLWQGERTPDFIAEVIRNLLRLPPATINPYILENSLPQLINNADNSQLQQIESITDRLLLEYPNSYQALYLKALLEYKLDHHQTALHFALRAAERDIQPQLLPILVNAYRAMGLLKNAFDVIIKNKAMLLNSVLWLKINMANTLWLMQLDNHEWGNVLSELCDSDKDSIELKAISCRYKASIGKSDEAISILDSGLKHSSAPDWVFLEYLRLLEKTSGIQHAVEAFKNYSDRVNNPDSFVRYIEC